MYCKWCTDGKVGIFDSEIFLFREKKWKNQFLLRVPMIILFLVTIFIN